MTEIQTIQIHATCVSQGNAGVLIRGPSGAGKSDLALRLIESGANLIADDQVTLQVSDGRVVALASTCLPGVLEVRGVGILRMQSQTSAPIRLVVDLTRRNNVTRLPPKLKTRLAEIYIPKIDLWAFEASAVTKVRLALDLALSRIVPKND